MPQGKSLGGKEKKMGTVKNLKLRVHSEKLVLLHGWTYSSDGSDPLRKWQPFIELLESQGIRCELPRIPGITKDINEFWTLDEYADWLKKMLSKDNKIILVGHSNGGRIAFKFTQKYPEKVTKLILIDSAGIYHNELPLRFKRFLFRNIAKIGRKFTESEGLRKLIYIVAREGDYSNATPSQRQTMLNLINSDLTEILKEVKAPTLIIWGEKDKVTPLSDGQLIHSLIKNSKLSIIGNARHSPQFTNPKEVAKLINDFI